MTIVLIGSPALAEAASGYGTTQVIRPDAMAEDEAFVDVVKMVFGTRDPADVAALHRASGGRMSPLVHLARMRGLEPLYALRPDQILSLPGPEGAGPG